MAAWLLLALSAALVVVCGVFVAAEFSFLAADRAGVQREADAGDRRAQGVLRAFAELSTQLSGVQIGITVTNLAIGLLAEPSIAGLLHGPLRSVGLDGGAVDAVAVAAALVVSTVVTMVVGELVPKNLAISRPIPTAKAVQASVRSFARVMGGPIRALNGIADALLRPLGIEATEELASARSAQELVSLVAHSAAEGTLERSTARLLTRSLSFGDRRAGDVLTPRVRMVTVAAQDSVADALAVVRRSGHSRFPVLGPEGLDDVVGTVGVRHLVAVPATDRARTPVGAIAAPAVVVLALSRLESVLDALQAGGTQLAVVVDEYGGTDGLLTTEDLLEELVGAVTDEHDAVDDDAQQDGDGWIVSGLLRADEVRSRTGIALPDGHYETIAGLVLDLLGRIPDVGDRARSDCLEFRVEAMAGRRIDRVRVTRRE